MLISNAQAQALWGYADTNPLLPQLTALLPGADIAVKRYCERCLEPTSITEYLSGNNRQLITLKQTPVITIQNLWVSNSGYFGTNAESPFDDTTLFTEGKQFVLDHDQPDGSSRSGIIFRIGAIWEIQARIVSTNLLTPYQGPIFGNIKVQYTAGYNPIPADLQYAVAATAQFMRRTINYGGMIAHSEKLGDYAYSLLIDPRYQYLVGSVLEILGRYKEVGW